MIRCHSRLSVCLSGPLQSQHSHLVIQQLLGHLDANSKSSATVRAGIVEVLLEAAAIAASGSVGGYTLARTHVHTGAHTLTHTHVHTGARIRVHACTSTHK